MEKIKVRVVDSTGDTMEFNQTSVESWILTLKFKISPIRKIPVTKIQLSYEGQVLEDLKSLQEYGIKEGSLLSFVEKSESEKRPRRKLSKESCRNCGGCDHDEKSCFERPRKFVGRGKAGGGERKSQEEAKEAGEGKEARGEGKGGAPDSERSHAKTIRNPPALYLKEPERICVYEHKSRSMFPPQNPNEGFAESQALQEEVLDCDVVPFPSLRRELRIHESLDDLSAEIIKYIAELSDLFVKERGVFAIVLSGSLMGLLRKLYEPPYTMAIDWAKWHIFWIDSNCKLEKADLLSKVPNIPCHVHSIVDFESAEEAAEEYELSIRQLVTTRIINSSDIDDCPKFDLILLEMGCDGHVASLFPNHSALAMKNVWVTSITECPMPPHERISFTFSVINSASNVAVVAAGGNKAEAARLAISEVEPDDPYLCPARLVKPGKGKLVWFLDQEAASGIHS